MSKLPGINHLDAVRALEKAGFHVVRQGEHVVMSNGSRILTIPGTMMIAKPPGEIPPPTFLVTQ